MAKINVVNSKSKSKKPIRLDECDYGALVKVNGDYCIVVDHYFVGQEDDGDIPVLDLETGEILFLSGGLFVRIYCGDLTIDEEQFKEFEWGN